MKPALWSEGVKREVTH